MTNLLRRRGIRLQWTVTAIVVLLLSVAAGPPAGITSGAQTSLALLHLTVGLIVILGLPRGRAVRQHLSSADRAVTRETEQEATG